MAHSSIVSRSSSRRDSLLILSGALAGASASALLFYRALRRRARSLAMERAGRCRLERELRDLGLRLDPPPDAPRERSGKVRPEFLERYGFRAIGTIRACFSDCGASNQREPIYRESEDTARRARAHDDSTASQSARRGRRCSLRTCACASNSIRAYRAPGEGGGRAAP